MISSDLYLFGLSNDDVLNGAKPKRRTMHDGARCNEMGPDVCQMRFASVRLKPSQIRVWSDQELLTCAPHFRTPKAIKLRGLMYHG